MLLQILPVVVFIGCVALVLGAYQMFIVQPERKVLDRLRPKRDTEKALRGVLKEGQSPGPASGLAARFEPMRSRIHQLLEQAGSTRTVQGFLGLSAMAAVLGGLVAAWFGGWVVGLVGGVVMGFGPTMLTRRARTARIFKFEEQFPEAIDLIGRALRAGHALPTGLGMVADEMPAPVGREFRLVFDEQNFGLTLSTALHNFARRVPVLDAQFFVVAVLTQREAGGNLAEVLDNLAMVIRERFKIKRQIRVVSAHGRITGWVLGLLPPCLAVISNLITGGATFGTLLGDPVGRKMLIGAGVLQVVGMISIQKIVDIEY